MILEKKGPACESAAGCADSAERLATGNPTTNRPLAVAKLARDNPGDDDDDDSFETSNRTAAAPGDDNNALLMTAPNSGETLGRNAAVAKAEAEAKAETEAKAKAPKGILKKASSTEAGGSLKKVNNNNNPKNSPVDSNKRMVTLISNDKSSTTGKGKKLLTKQLVGRQLRSINSVIFSKIKLLLLLLGLILLTFGNDLTLLQNVQAGFWTFYFPNILKPSGYKDITKMIDAREVEINSIKDNYADVKYFWDLMIKMEDVLKSSAQVNFQVYPEESVCSEIFPMFRDMAIEYSKIDYQHYMAPLESHHENLIHLRGKWFPEGEKSKNILPRQWEQELYEKDLLVQIDWAQKLANNEEFKEKRRRMGELYNSVKRSLDTSLPCVYLKYAFRQVSEDINQLALEMNINAMKGALNMVKSAYKRIEKFKDSDQIAIEAISDAMKAKERFQIKS